MYITHLTILNGMYYTCEVVRLSPSDCPDISEHSDLNLVVDV